MSLTAGPREVALSIVDDGVGFTVREAWGRGLGLISMGERVEAIGGTFQIRSQLGQGTEIDVRVPLETAPAAAERADSA
jgi:signal transduction histidine kinase